MADARECRGWLSALRRDLSNRRRRADDDGTPFTDELLVVIFARVPDLADLVRCAATCRRWRRLVSGEAALICRTPRRPPGRFIGQLALGFFHLQLEGLLFMPTAFASRRFPGLLQQPPPSLNKLFDDGLFDGFSHIVASRNGLLVINLESGNHDRALKLCVCNPMAGVVHVLPHLGGMDGLGHYVCTVLTADDRDEKIIDPPRSTSYFRLVMLYTRCGFTAFRSYSSEEGSWSEEAKLTNSRLGRKQMGLTNDGLTHNGVVGRGGRLVYWLSNKVVFVLCLETLQLSVVSMPRSGNSQGFDMANTLLGLSPNGMLCAIQLGRMSLRPANRRVPIRVITCTDRSWWDMEELIQVGQSLPEDVGHVMLRWFCEKSGAVFFSTFCGSYPLRSEMYVLNLKTRVVDKLASEDRISNPWACVHGYEMDQTAYLASLAEPEGVEDM